MYYGRIGLLGGLIFYDREAGEVFVKEKFKSGATTSRNEAITQIWVVRDEVFDKASGVAAADNTDNALFFADEFSSNSRGGSISWIFGFAEETVPDNSVCIGNEAG